MLKKKYFLNLNKKVELFPELVELGKVKGFLENKNSYPDFWREAWEGIPNQVKVILEEYANTFPLLPEMGLPYWAVEGAIWYGVGLFKIGLETEEEWRERNGY